MDATRITMTVFTKVDHPELRGPTFRYQPRKNEVLRHSREMPNMKAALAAVKLIRSGDLDCASEYPKLIVITQEFPSGVVRESIQRWYRDERTDKWKKERR